MFTPRSPSQSSEEASSAAAPAASSFDPTATPTTDAEVLAQLNFSQTRILPRHEFNAIIKELPADLCLEDKKRAVIKARDDKCSEYQRRADECVTAMIKPLGASEKYRAKDTLEMYNLRQTGLINACIVYVPMELWKKVPAARARAHRSAERKKTTGVSKRRRKPAQPSDAEPTRRSQRIKERKEGKHR